MCPTQNARFGLRTIRIKLAKAVSIESVLGENHYNKSNCCGGQPLAAMQLFFHFN